MIIPIKVILLINDKVESEIPFFSLVGGFKGHMLFFSTIRLFSFHKSPVVEI